MVAIHGLEQLILFSCVYLAALPVLVLFMFPHGRNEHLDGQLGIKISKVRSFSIFATVVTSLNDILLVAVPARPVLRLNLALEKRSGMMAVFMVGIIAITATTINLYFRIIFNFYDWKVPDID